MRAIPALWSPLILALGLVFVFAVAPAPSSWSLARGASSHQAQSQATKSDIQSLKADGESQSRAAGNGASSSGKAEGLLVVEVLLLLVVGRVLGEGMQRIGQPSLMGTLFAGIVLGPSLFGWLWPAAQHALFPKDEAQKAMIDGLSQIGILMLLLLTGMETDLKLVRRSQGAAGVIALCGIAFPFVCGFVLGQFGPYQLFGNLGSGRLVASLFLGTALSISSIKIVAMVVREMNFMRRNLGQIIVATAIIEDTCGWVIIAITLGITGTGAGSSTAMAVGSLYWLDLAKTLGGVALFLVFCFTLGRWLVFTAIRWVNDNFQSDFAVITAILVIMCSFAETTQLLGVRTVLGAFMAGVLVGESPILTDHIQAQLRGMITAFFMPIFFGMSGLAADLTILKDWTLLGLTALLVVIASIGKFAGAFTGALMGRLTWREGIALGCAMNARGSTEVIVASIGLSMGALSPTLYTMIVTMAVITTLSMPPMLRWALGDLPMSKEEETRIAREAIDQRGFLPRLERMLLALDDSATGRLAARLAGLLAGAQGMPVTILKLEADLRFGEKDGSPGAWPFGQTDPDATGETTQGDWLAAQSRRESAADLQTDPLAKALKAGARKSAAKLKAFETEPDPEKVHLTARVPLDPPIEVVKREARKGHDLMFLGLKDSVEKDGVLASKITQLSAGFDGPLIVLADKGAGRLDGKSRILVPVNGTPQSRRAAEIAFALARATGARVRTLFVSQTDQPSRARLREERILKDMTELAQRYDVSVSTRISPRAAPASAILREARRDFTWIVMGVSPRPGEELFFGNTATAVLREWQNPILVLAS